MLKRDIQSHSLLSNISLHIPLPSVLTLQHYLYLILTKQTTTPSAVVKLGFPHPICYATSARAASGSHPLYVQDPTIHM